MMLPKPTDTSFPDALKAAREAKGYSFKELAELVGISQVMPSRYENRDHSNFGPPSDKTWRKLNTVLFGIENDRNGIAEQAEDSNIRLADATVEDIVAELKARGAQSVKIEF